MRQLPPDQAQRRPRQSTGATLHSADTLPAAQMNQVARLIITRVPQVMRPTVSSARCTRAPTRRAFTPADRSGEDALRSH